jgi:quinol monooxygenase YgiN
MYVVMTRVKLKPGTHQACAKLFEETNPELVRSEPDWLGARMIFDHDREIVTVLATWRNAQSYKRLSSSSEFQQTMQRFGELFASPPEVSVNSVLVEMMPQVS